MISLDMKDVLIDSLSVDVLMNKFLEILPSRYNGQYEDIREWMTEYKILNLFSTPYGYSAISEKLNAATIITVNNINIINFKTMVEYFDGIDVTLDNYILFLYEYNDIHLYKRAVEVKKLLESEVIKLDMVDPDGNMITEGKFVNSVLSMVPTRELVPSNISLFDIKVNHVVDTEESFRNFRTAKKRYISLTSKVMFPEDDYVSSIGEEISDIMFNIYFQYGLLYNKFDKPKMFKNEYHNEFFKYINGLYVDADSDYGLVHNKEDLTIEMDKFILYISRYSDDHIKDTLYELILEYCGFITRDKEDITAYVRAMIFMNGIANIYSDDRLKTLISDEYRAIQSDIVELQIIVNNIYLKLREEQRFIEMVVV